ncbi:uncharacterized protein [Dermacentor albipictus]|uniref:uncharacterized protein n=1 Tax=Dermacentor albipictus TaxID=60249 RepID=UPI0038FC0967
MLRASLLHLPTVEVRTRWTKKLWCKFFPGIRRKLTAASRKGRCRELLSWIQPIVNHLYWCACACGGNGDLLVATWTSLLNHIADIHDGHGNPYPRCLHGPSSRVSWLKIDSPAHKQVRAIVMAPVLLKDIRQLSPDTQTYSLESFHSVLNGYAPKSTAYTYEGMKARTLIAALHFNENANKEQATTKDGTQQWHSKTSKARHSMMTVCPLKMAATFGKFNCVTSVFQLAVLLYKCSAKLHLTLHLQAIHKLML